MWGCTQYVPSQRPDFWLKKKALPLAGLQNHNSVQRPLEPHCGIFVCNPLMYIELIYLCNV